MLTANTNNLNGDGTISYQWNRVAAAGGTSTSTPIGANSNGYTVQAADVGNTITVTVTRDGYSGSVTSAAVGPVTNPQGTATLNITFAQIADAAPLIVDQTISRTGANRTVELEATNPNQYTSIVWNVTGTGVSGSGPTFILDAANTAYNTVGEHFLTVDVWKDGIPYNKTIIFTVTE
jgi:hypothetical protein